MWSTVKRLLLGGVSTLVQAVVLFGAAGRLDWVLGWAFIGVYAIGGMATPPASHGRGNTSFCCHIRGRHVPSEHKRSRYEWQCIR